MGRRKADISPKSQFGALCYRRAGGKLRVLLVTSRGTGQWLTPKGWPMPKRSPAEAAAREAFEEAGVEGDIHPDCLGIYRHAKSGGVDCAVAVYPLRVRRTHSRFPEKCQRKRKWMSPKRAAAAVDNAELAGIIASFDPKALAS